MGTSSVFSHEVGFYGYVKIGSGPAGGAAELVTVLATGGDLNLATDPIFSSGVWGAGWYTAANQVAYAVNYMRIEGSAAFELAAAESPALGIFDAVKSFAFDERANTNGHIVELKPNGKGGFSGKAWCSGCSFDASADSIVNGNINFSSGDLSDANWSITQQTVDGTKLSTGAPPAPTAVYPYWATEVGIDTTVGGTNGSSADNVYTKLNDVVSWNANYTSEINFVNLCSGGTTNPLAPDYIMVGGMDADGSFTIFSLTSQLSPATFQAMKACQIQLRPGNNLTTANKITFPYIVYNQGSTSIQTGGQYITADISFTALGDGTKPPMSVE